MSDTILQECRKCGGETDCIDGVCQECFINELEEEQLINLDEGE